MGALTLKTFPFELRGWDIEKFESLDPTDGFGSNTRVYVSKNQVIQIEPDYNTYSLNAWLSDKGRQFFDGIFQLWTTDTKETSNLDSWSVFFAQITKTLYLFDHCNKQNYKTYFFTIIVENLSLEMLNILVLLSNNYSFIKLRKTEASNTNLNLESNFQLNDSLDKKSLATSSLCLLISTNPRYEGYQLNLKLRHRALKGNFKCLIIGSLINLTFSTLFLGSNTKILKTIIEGNNLVCQDLKFAKNPMIVYNNELHQSSSGRNIAQSLQTLNQYDIFSKTWNGLNVLNPRLSDTGNFLLTQIPKVTSKDFENFSGIYFLNTTMDNNISNLKKITELKLLKSSLTYEKKFLQERFVFDQNYKINNNSSFAKKLSTEYTHALSSSFYANEETFVNTEGFIKHSTQLLSKKENKDNWQILRRFLKQTKAQIDFLDKGTSELINFNLKNFYNFKNLTNFIYYATQNLNNLSYYLNKNNKPIKFKNSYIKLKPASMKVFNTKLKFWLDDFYIGGKDEYSRNSVVLNNCSRILRTESTNFF